MTQPDPQGARHYRITGDARDYCAIDHADWPCDAATLIEALVDILELSKGEPRMGGGSTFPANAHRMGRIHNRARRAFGEEPLTILATPDSTGARE